jgi:hypothetical protein
MVIEQTVEIPADRRLVVEVPNGFPTGKATLRLIEQTTEETKSAFKYRVLSQPKKIKWEQAEAARLRLRGMFKTDGHDVDRFINWKQSERDIEYVIEQREAEERKQWRKN